MQINIYLVIIAFPELKVIFSSGLLRCSCQFVCDVLAVCARMFALVVICKFNVHFLNNPCAIYALLLAKSKIFQVYWSIDFVITCENFRKYVGLSVCPNVCLSVCLSVCL